MAQALPHADCPSVAAETDDALRTTKHTRRFLVQMNVPVRNGIRAVSQCRRHPIQLGGEWGIRIKGLLECRPLRNPFPH